MYFPCIWDFTQNTYAMRKAMNSNPKGFVNANIYYFKSGKAVFSCFNVFLNTKGNHDTSRISGGPKAVSGFGRALPSPYIGCHVSRAWREKTTLIRRISPVRKGCPK